MVEIKDKTRHWYAVHTYSGYEDAVTRYLKQRVDSLSMNDKIFEVLVPKETKIKIKNGKRRTVEEKIYPGYVLVDMIFNRGFLVCCQEHSARDRFCRSGFHNARPALKRRN